MAECVRFGILGCGVIGSHHAQTIAGLKHEAILVTVADHHENRAAKLAQEHGVKAYGSLHNLLNYPVQIQGTESMANREQIRNFIAATRHEREPLVNIEEGRKPVAIIRAIYESA